MSCMTHINGKMSGVIASTSEFSNVIFLLQLPHQFWNATVMRDTECIYGMWNIKHALCNIRCIWILESEMCMAWKDKWRVSPNVRMKCICDMSRSVCETFMGYVIYNAYVMWNMKYVLSCNVR